VARHPHLQPARRAIGSNVNICQYTNLISKDQNCQTPGDRYQFLLFHRHRLQLLKQLWPKHAADFDVFPTFPQSASDLAKEWQAAWMPFTGTDLSVGKMLDAFSKCILQSERCATQLPDGVSEESDVLPIGPLGVSPGVFTVNLGTKLRGSGRTLGERPKATLIPTCRVEGTAPKGKLGR